MSLSASKSHPNERLPTPYKDFRSLKFESVLCRATYGKSPPDFPPDGLVHEGTPCGQHLVCVNQTCVSIYQFIDQTRCPSNNDDVECNGKGVSFSF